LWTRVSDNALPLGLIAGGVLWLMRSQPKTNRRWAEAGGDDFYDTGVGSDARQLASRAADKAAHVGDRVVAGASRVGARAKEQTQRLAGRTRESFDAVRAEQPLILGAAAVALGALVGGLIPGTRREDELLGEARDQVVQAAADAGIQKTEQLRGGAGHTQ
jgi:hypothetical protein